MIQKYIDNLDKRYQTGKATEHTYRPDLQNLLENLLPDILVTNEPARIKCGAPDYVLTRKNIPVGYIEAKDIAADLKSKLHKEQFDRYRRALDNLVFTDYLQFQFYQSGEFVTTVAIAEVKGKRIVGKPENYAHFTALIKDFVTQAKQTITAADDLSKMMAAKAKLLAAVIEQALLSDEDDRENSTLKEQLIAFDEILIHDIQPKEFADIYAQTIAYGMFAARLHDTSLDTFTRQKAAQLIPYSNPFLRKMFQYIAGYDLDSRIVWIVDALADIFRATDVSAILKNFGKTTQTQDPIIHFYENFLAEYDPALRKARGVWYTPEPVVQFIVRAVDDVLKAEFGLKKGLADTSKTKISQEVATKKTADRRSKMTIAKVEKEVHSVQILDPATGTGTFLAEIVRFIYQKHFKTMQGAWSSYVENDLIPRLNGFELLMASYAMAHLKLDLLLTETGYKSSKTPQNTARFKVFLTNSLEEAAPEAGTLFASWLSEEANQANAVKRDNPVMVILGNPPYSGESANKGQWISTLMEDYKKEPNSTQKLQERNPKWINDDYVKFIRFGQHLIERNGEGVLAFINPHGYLDNPTFRGMRWNLLNTYDKIYTIDLHGNAKKKETAPDGSPDQNVFDIMQGVSINIFIKTGKKKAGELAQVFHYDLFGKREVKYDFLKKHSLKTIPFVALPNTPPMYFMVQKDFQQQAKYEEGFAMNELFTLNSVGIVTANDSLYVAFDEKQLEKQILEKYKSIDKKLIRPIAYRPFDVRFLYNNVNLIERSRVKVMQHFLRGGNLGLVTIRRSRSSQNWQEIFVSNSIISGATAISALDINYLFPLYLYPEINGQQTLEPTPDRTPNLKAEIIQQIAASLGMRFTPEKENTDHTFAPIDVLDYIYGVLHSPKYREEYKEFLKIDFPRVPYPKRETFWDWVALGGQLRRLHLLEFDLSDMETVISYPENGDNCITRKMTQNSAGYIADTDTHGKVWINDTQYFEGVPLVAWEFYIGGYQPAQKWLKDRVGRVLSFEDLKHYQKIIAALAQTHFLMNNE